MKKKTMTKKCATKCAPKKKAQTAKTPAVRVSRTNKLSATPASLLQENTDLRLRLSEAEQTLTAIRKGEVDALVVSGPRGEQIYTLKGADQPYRILVESVNEGALTLTAEGAIINCNKGFSKIAGVSAGTLIGTFVRDLVSKKDRDKFEAFWKQGGETEGKAEIELQLDGRKVPAFVSLSSRMHEGECWVFMVVADITERKRTEAKLEEYRLHLERMVDEKTAELQTANEELQTTNEELLTANKELEAFIYSVSHDLRAPLRHISGFTHAVLQEYASKLDAQGRDYLTRVHAGAAKMARLIDDLLQLSRVSRQELSRGKVDLSATVSAVIADYRQADPGRDVEITIREGAVALADHGLMKVAVTNLVANAWKFTSKTSRARIEFGMFEEDGGLVYFVKDNGAGFDPAYADKLFLPFRRLHSETEFEGTGIGLALVERIIAKHGGKVWAEGEIDKGATIFFTLG